MGCAPRHHQAHGGIKLGRSEEISQAAHFCTVGRFSATVERLLERLPAPGDRRATLGRLASCQNADTSGNLGQIIVELVIAAAEPINDRAGYRSLIKIDMRKRRSVVLAAVIEIDRRLLRQSRAEVCRWLDVFTRPAARTKKRRRDKKYAGKPSV